jgi:phytoene synthase
MRLAFWHEVLDEIFQGRPVRAHPAAQALAAAVRRHTLPRAPLQSMLDARDRELDRKPLTAEEARALGASTGGESAALAARVLEPHAPAGQVLAQGARWALSRLLLAGRIAEPQAPAVRAQLLGQGRAPPIPAAAFPAAAHAALARPYAAGRRPSELEKRLRITWAVARGRA